MKMGFSFIIGLVFIFIGLEILLRLFFNVSIPLFRILFALLVIYVGVCIFLGKPVFKPFLFSSYKENKEMFGSYSQVYKDREITNETESIVFGEKIIDLREIKIKGEKAQFRIDCIFGNVRVMLDKNIPVRITANSAFGSIEMPESNNIVFGTRKYDSQNFNADKKHIEINASVVFGHIAFINPK